MRLGISTSVANFLILVQFVLLWNIKTGTNGRYTPMIFKINVGLKNNGWLEPIKSENS